jgi:hypothetical protein
VLTLFLDTQISQERVMSPEKYQKECDPKPGGAGLKPVADDDAKEVFGHITGMYQFFQNRQIPYFWIKIAIVFEAIIQHLQPVSAFREFRIFRKENWKGLGKIGRHILLHRRQRSERRPTKGIGFVVMLWQCSHLLFHS